MCSEGYEGEIATLRKSLRRSQIMIFAIAITALAIAGWNYHPTVLRANRLEIVDSQGKLRARISAEAYDTRLLLIGAPAPNGKGKTPTVEFQLGVNSQVLKIEDETGSLTLNSGELVMDDPKAKRRIEIIRQTPDLAGRSGLAYLRIWNTGTFPVVTLPLSADRLNELKE